MSTQPGLFADLPEAPTVASGISAVRTDPGASDAALAGDGYGWLAELLPAPAAPTCEECGAVMVLPGAAPVLWTCPACHPAEVSR
jgi:hypothetical protein